LHYDNYYAIACGVDKKDRPIKSVEICDTTTSTWHTAQPLPVAGHSMCSVVFGDTWYLSGVWEDMMPHIYKVSIPSLIENATKGEGNAKSLWEEVPSPPSDHFHLLKFHNALTTVGGKNYSQDIKFISMMKILELGSNLECFQLDLIHQSLLNYHIQVNCL